MQIKQIWHFSLTERFQGTDVVADWLDASILRLSEVKVGKETGVISLRIFS
jgi:hypothetical protein